MTAELTLWNRAKTGDGESFAEIFDLHRDRVFRHVLRLVDSVADAEDVVAVAFMELWRRRDIVRVVNGSVLAWLLVTATNAARNASRSTRRYRAMLNRLPRSEAAQDAAEQYLHSSLDGLDPRLATQLRSLGRIDQQLLVLVVLEGYPLSEAAEVLGLSLAATKSRMHRLRRRLAPSPGTSTRRATT